MRMRGYTCLLMIALVLSHAICLADDASHRKAVALKIGLGKRKKEAAPAEIAPPPAARKSRATKKLSIKV